MNLKDVTKLRIEHPNRIGSAETSVTLRAGARSSIEGNDYEVVMDKKGDALISVKGDVVVTLPLDAALEEADIDIKKGDVKVTGIKGLKTLKISGTMGDTDISGISVEKTISIESISGDATIRDTEAGKVTHSTMAGDLRVDADVSRIEAESISGNISIKARDEGAMNLSTVAGNITIKTDEEPAVEFLGQERKYFGPESNEDSTLKIRASSIAGALSIKS